MNQLHSLSRSLLPALFAAGVWSGCSAEPASQTGNLPATGGASSGAPGSGGTATAMGGSAVSPSTGGNTGGVAPSTGGATSGGSAVATGGAAASGSSGMASGGTLVAGGGSGAGGGGNGGNGGSVSATGGSVSATGGSASGGNSGGSTSGASSGGKASGGKASGGNATGGGATGGSAGASTCNLPATVSFQKDVQPFLITACGGGNGCHVVDASSTMSSGGYNHAYDWITGGAHTSSCPTGPMRFQIVLDVINAANPATCSKSRKMPPPDATGAGLRTPLTRCQVETLQAWLSEPLVTQMHRADDSSPTTPYPMPPFN